MQPASPSVLNSARLTVSVFLIFFFFFLISCIFRCVGDYVSVSNPEGNFIISQLQELEDLFLLAAGTGFTPMVKVLNYALTNIPSLRYVILHLIPVPCEAVRLVEGVLNLLKTQWTSTDMFSSLSHHFFLFFLYSKLFYSLDSFSFVTFDYLIDTEKTFMLIHG